MPLCAGGKLVCVPDNRVGRMEGKTGRLVIRLLEKQKVTSYFSLERLVISNIFLLLCGEKALMLTLGIRL